jgi:hypothetical protein
MTDIHSCGYYCDKPLCIKAQRDELRDKLFAKEWQGLTDEEKVEIQMLKWWDWEDTFDLDGYTRAIEAKLKEKNA